MTTRIIFTLPSEKAGHAEAGIILGDFNNWNPDEAVYLQKKDDGSMVAELYLTAGKTYQYRYLLSDGRWVNDNSQTAFADVYGHPVENCVISVPVPESKKRTAVKKQSAKTATGKSVTAADDLKKIEGIGKKTAQLLASENISTYKELGKTSIKKLKSILLAAGEKQAGLDPSTWPKQAKLAAAGKWDELTAMQEQIKAGSR